ncbi:MAG: hypothetical protein MRY74_10480 [Neomegalonema sp.]|nr:hypothetical protein [Neomegalonema sp.]
MEPSSDETIYSAGDVRISSSVARFGRAEYPISRITGVSVIRSARYYSPFLILLAALVAPIALGLAAEAAFRGAPPKEGVKEIIVAFVIFFLFSVGIASLAGHCVAAIARRHLFGETSPLKYAGAWAFLAIVVIGLVGMFASGAYNNVTKLATCGEGACGLHWRNMIMLGLIALLMALIAAHGVRAAYRKNSEQHVLMLANEGGAERAYAHQDAALIEEIRTTLSNLIGRK